MNNEDQGKVIKSTGSWYIVENKYGERINCKFKGSFKMSGINATNPVVVGDNVLYNVISGSSWRSERGDESDDFNGLISKILPRRNYLLRKSINLSKHSHVLASNIDNVIIVVTLVLPKTSTGFIDRVLFTAESYHIPAMLLFNKFDIYDKDLIKDLESLKNTYTSIGYNCLEVSAITGLNLDQLKSQMKDKVNMFVGHSGVGKSTLINAIQPGLSLKTSDISLMHSKGKHTTTFAEMHKLDFDAYIIDTPGIKEFTLIEVEKSEVAGYFPDLYQYSQECRFKNCKHLNEPDCAVKNAVIYNKISESRYKSYLSIMFSDETIIKYDD